MPAKSIIIDPADKHAARVDSTDGEEQALVVATRPLKTYTSEIQFLRSDEGSIDMNVNGSPSGTTVETLYDENTEWAAANVISNDFVFDDAGPAGSGPYSGSVCIDATTTSNNDTMELSYGGDFDLTPYSNLTGWIYLTGWSSGGTKEVDFLAYYGGSPLGVAVDIGTYIDTNLLGVWQQFVVPLSDMGLVDATIDSMRVFTVDIGTGPPPNYWLDLIEFVQPSGDGTQQFFVRPDTAEWIYIDKIHVFFATGNSVNVDGSNNIIPYDSLLGVDITNGILYQRVEDGVITTIDVVRTMGDILQNPSASLGEYGGDGTNTWLTANYVFAEPLVLKWETADSLRVLINDDLTEFDTFRAGILGWVESRLSHKD